MCRGPCVLRCFVLNPDGNTEAWVAGGVTSIKLRAWAVSRLRPADQRPVGYLLLVALGVRLHTSCRATGSS